MSNLILMLLFVVPLMLLMIKKRHANVVGRKKLPPGPKKLPLIGNMHQLSKFSHQLLQHLSHAYGPLFFLQLGSFPSIVVSSAHIVQEICKKNDLIFSGRYNSYAARKIFYDGSNFTFAGYGDCWRNLRKIVITELLSVKRVQAFGTIREEEVSRMINSITSSSGTLVNVSELVISMIYNVLQRVLFGDIKDDGMRKFREMFHEAHDLLITFNIVDAFPKLWWINKFNGVEARSRKTFMEFDKFYDQVIEEHITSQSKSSSGQESLLDVLLQHRNNHNQEFGLTNEHIKGVFMDIFLAGIDPSAITVIWAMIELIKNPSIMRKAQDEIKRNVQDEEKRLPIKEHDLSKLEYLKLVVKEVLRLHCPFPIPLPRETIEDCSIAGYDIPAKTRVLFNAGAISVDPEHWDNPMEFNPERFVNRCVDFRGRDPAFIPFGTGRRGCPGSHFAVLLIELVLANLLHCFEWVLPQGTKPQDLDMEETMGINMLDKAPLHLIAIAK